MITCLYLIALFIGYSQQDITPDVKINVEVPAPKYIKHYPNGTINMYVQRGSNLLMECTVFNMPIIGSIMWILYPYIGQEGKPITINKGQISYDLSRYKIGQGKQPNSIRLEILSVDESYAGIFSCEIMYSANVKNAVDKRTLMIYDLPQITYTEFNNKIDTGKDITLKCIATGIPPPSVIWRRIGGNSNIIKGTGVVLYSNQITLTKVTYADAGIYACYAANEWGEVERKFSLQVSHAPVVSITPNGNDAFQRLGCMLQLICVVKGNPVPPTNQITWSSSSAGTITTGGRITTKFLASINQEIFFFLRIYPTTLADLTATYSCSATNHLGSSSASVTLRTSPNSNPLITGPYACGALSLNVSLLLLVVSFSSFLVIGKF